MKELFKRSDIRFIVSLIVAHFIFFLIALHFKKIYNGDSAEYIYMALNIKDHFWFYSGNPALPVVPEYFTLRPPGYPLFLILVYLFAVNNWVVLLLQNIISIFNVYYLRSTIRKIGYSRKYDWILIAFVMLYPSQFINANLIAPDILLQTCVLVYFCQFILLIKEKKWRHTYFMSFALVAGLLIKPVLYPFAYIHCLLMLWALMNIKKGHLRPFGAALIPLTVVMLYGYWNYQRTGKLHFTSTQSFNAVFYYYTYFSHRDGKEKANEFLYEEHAKMSAIPKFNDRYDYAIGRGYSLLRENFLPYMAFHTEHSALMLVAPGKGELDMFIGNLSLGSLYSSKVPPGLFDSIRKRGVEGLREYLHNNPSFPIAIMVLFFNCIRLIGLILFAFNKTVDKPIRIFIFFLIAYFMFIAGPIANARYFIPVSLITIGCSAIGFQRLMTAKKDESRADLKYAGK